MVADAEQHADEDKRKREEIELRNNAENTAYAAEKLLSDNADKVPDELKEEIEGQIAALRTALEGEDTGAISTALQEVQTAMQKVGEAVYSQQPGAAGEQAPGGDDAGDDETPPEDTVEGEYREV